MILSLSEKNRNVNNYIKLNNGTNAMKSTGYNGKEWVVTNYWQSGSNGELGQSKQLCKVSA